MALAACEFSPHAPPPLVLNALSVVATNRLIAATPFGHSSANTKMMSFGAHFCMGED